MQQYQSYVIMFPVLPSRKETQQIFLNNIMMAIYIADLLQNNRI